MIKNKLFKIVAAGSTLALMASLAAPALANENYGQEKKDERKGGVTLQINHQGKVVMNRAEVVSVSAPSLVVKVWGTNWTVYTTSDTKIVRHFGGSSILAEYAPGDFVNVRGQIVPGQLAVNATHVQNQSTRAASFRGTIATITAPDMLTVRVGDMDKSVKVAADAKITIGDATKTFADLAVGMQVTVKGYMNRLSTVFTAYKINARPLPAPTPTLTP